MNVLALGGIVATCLAVVTFGTDVVFANFILDLVELMDDFVFTKTEEFVGVGPDNLIAAIVDTDMTDVLDVVLFTDEAVDVDWDFKEGFDCFINLENDAVEVIVFFVVGTIVAEVL